MPATSLRSLGFKALTTRTCQKLRVEGLEVILTAESTPRTKRSHLTSNSATASGAPLVSTVDNHGNDGLNDGARDNCSRSSRSSSGSKGDDVPYEKLAIIMMPMVLMLPPI